MANRSEHDDRIMEILTAAMRKPLAERELYVRVVCNGDENLRQEVTDALSWEERMGGFLQHPAALDEHSGAGCTVANILPIATGLVIAQYRIESKLGEGGMGTVYLAFDTRLHRRVAIKFLADNLADAEGRRRFQREAQMVSALNHPHIVAVYDVGEFEGRQYLVMEYVDGGTLKDWAKEKKRTTDEVAELLIPVADGLSAAHRAGILHRDIKPTNILVSRNGYAKLADFGLAKLAEKTEIDITRTTAEGPTRPGAILGTFAYMSPEQASGQTLDSRSDIFSFGVVLYEVLAGTKAFTGQSIYSVIRDEPKPLSEVQREIPREVCAVVNRCLKKDPTARFASGAELALELKKCRDHLFRDAAAVLSPARLIRMGRRPSVLIPLMIVAITIVAGTTWILKRNRDVRWARDLAIPEISRLSDAGKNDKAYSLAVKAEKFIPDDPVLAKLWPRISFPLSLETTPPGVDVYRRDYVNTTAPWELVGRTPLSNVRQPAEMFIWKLEKQGFSTAFRTSFSLTTNVILDGVANTPSDMVRVPATDGRMTLSIPGYEGMPELALKEYWIDKYEVTNRQFKAFVDQGGYQKREYWKSGFRRDGKQLSWDEAMALLRDAAGRPGPKGWIQGKYPEGQDDFPVTGISWYEAAAYAQFAGKSLPTIYHWNWAAGPYMAPFVVPASNFGGYGVLAVGRKQDMTVWGNYDMAGNVKEWVWNESDSGKRYVLGGAWDEPSYMFVEPDAQSPFLRAPNVGFRCVKFIEPSSIPVEAMNPIPSPRREFIKEKPASNELFAAYKSQYSYDRIPLNAFAEPYGKGEEDWTAEKITYAAAYGNERATVYLFLPKNVKPPFQTVIVFPGSNAIDDRNFSLLGAIPSLDAILRSGRAVLYPVYKSTYGRHDELKSYYANLTSTYRDHVIMWVKDASRAIDYAVDRPDLDHSKLAYYGFSWGGEIGPFIAAIDPRIKVCVFAQGGLAFQQSLAEVDAINFLPRVKQPVLMLNGRYDFVFPMESSQKPFFQRLGSSRDQKKLLLYDTGHRVPNNEITRETLSWLDEYLGPVN